MGSFWKSGEDAAAAADVRSTRLASELELRLTIHFEDGDNGEFQIPACGGRQDGVPFHWDIDWGDGTRGRVSGVSSCEGGDVPAGSLMHQFAAPGSYEIILSPAGAANETTGNTPGWLQAFGYPHSRVFSVGENGARALHFPKGIDNLVGVDGVLDDRAINIELEGACAEMFVGCENITMGPNFTISSQKERAGDFFCAMMFSGCRGDAFAMGKSFQLPRNLRDVGEAFCCKMFEGCAGASFTMNDIFTIPQKITSAGSFFCKEMFEGHGPRLTMGKAFDLPQGLAEAEDEFCMRMFSSGSCDESCFNMNEVFNIPQRISGYVGRGFCYEMFSDNCGPVFSMNERFNIPPRITSAGAAFCICMFSGCSGDSFTMNDIFNLPEGLSEVGDGCCKGMFYGCRGENFKVNNIFNLPKNIIPVPLLAFMMFGKCHWDALNGSMHDIVRLNPNSVWYPPDAIKKEKSMEI